VAVSPDGARGWSRPRFDETLVEPICLASVCRLSLADGDGRNRLLFANPANLERADGKAQAGKSRDRRNLTIRLSYDEAGSWPVSKTLEPGLSAYSDLAVGPDHTIYCLYERGGRDPRDRQPQRPATLTLARFNLEWLTDGRDSLSRRP
jgi:sialidase-1